MTWFINCSMYNKEWYWIEGLLNQESFWCDKWCITTIHPYRLQKKVSKKRELEAITDNAGPSPKSFDPLHKNLIGKVIVYSVAIQQK